MFVIRSLATAGALLTLATGAAAQQHQQHGQGGQAPEQRGMQGGGMMPGMMEKMEEHMGGVGGIHAYQPGQILEHREHLSLTAAQVSKLEALAKATPPVDTGAMGQHHASLAHFSAAADARALLTPEQRAKVEEMIGHAHGGQGGGHDQH